MENNDAALPDSSALRDEMDAIYAGSDETAIPWVSETIPDELRTLADDGWIAPCRAIDLGCGTGNYARWFAGRGFEMTGVDLSPQAIRIARTHADPDSGSCRFLVADMCGDIPALEHEPFGFAYDWEVLHHVSPVQRSVYLRNVRHLLLPGARYYSAAFSETDDAFGGAGKIRTTPIGTRLYFSSLEEMRSLYEPLFMIEELRIIRIEGKHGTHRLFAARLRTKD